MHRSRPFVLVVLAAAAACSRHDASEGNDILSQDRTLAARIQTDQESSRSSLPASCGAIKIGAAPSIASQQQADELTRQAGVAEMHGDIKDARSLLRRASELDATNKSAAYHLGRTSEALGDRAAAMTAYCRYLAMAPTAAESTEARQRVTDLARSLPRATSTATDSVAAHRSVAATTTSRATHASPTVGSRVVARAPIHRSATAASRASETRSSSVVSSGEVRTPARSGPPTTSTAVDGTNGSATSGGDVVATRSVPTPDPAPMPPRAQRRGSVGVQSAIIGVAAGAILGATTGRSMKSAVIGAAAGGVLGTVIGSTTRPTRRGVGS